ncbi:MAG: prepilin-type N-terminal cleavage/methylation domain-containing protein [Rubrivivax sp.]
MCTNPEAQRPQRPSRPRQQGVSLVELVVAMALAGVILSGLWAAWSVLGRHSADPLTARQALVVAQSLLREIDLQPLPADGAVAGSTPGRTGYASISDYHGLVMAGITDAEGQAIAGLEGYTARVSVQNRALAGVPSAQGWWVRVDVTAPGGDTTSLAAWRAQR